jgi:amino acid transporter
MAFLSFIFFFFWKFFKRTSFKDPLRVDLVWECPAVDTYEAMERDAPTTFWREMRQMFRFRCKNAA